MSIEENKAIIRRGFEEILNQRNLDAVDTYFSSNYVGHDPALPEDLHGPEEFRQFAASYLSAFPDLHITIEDQFAEGDKVLTALRAGAPTKATLWVSLLPAKR